MIETKGIKFNRNGGYKKIPVGKSFTRQRKNQEQ